MGTKRTALGASRGMDLGWLAAVIAIVVGATCVLIFAPEPTIERLFGLLDKLPAGAWAGLATTLSGLAVAIWRSRTGGGPPASAVVLLLAVLVASSQLVGCGSAMQTQATAIRVIAAAHSAGADLAEATLSAELDRCSDVACVDAVETRWAPVAPASAGVILALSAWASTLRLIETAGDVPSLWRTALRQVEALAAAWDAWAVAARAVGWELPPIPVEVLAAARAIGGL